MVNCFAVIVYIVQVKFDAAHFTIILIGYLIFQD